MDDVEQAVLEYLESRGDGWRWIQGAKVFTKKETVKLFKENKRFRRMICKEVYKLAVDIFIRGARKKSTTH